MVLRNPITERYETKSDNQAGVRQIIESNELQGLGHLKEIEHCYYWECDLLSDKYPIKVELRQGIGEEGCTGGSVVLKYFNGTHKGDLDMLRQIIKDKGLEKVVE